MHKSIVGLCVFLLSINLIVNVEVKAGNEDTEKIVIYHTNDLHSFIEHAEYDDQKGGYTSLKNLIKMMRARDEKKGLSTFYVDAGDFLEGNIFYLIDRGRFSLKAYQELEPDVGVLGNHDYLMGTSGLNELFKDIPLKFPLLCANCELSDETPHLPKTIKPYINLKTKKGNEITFLGLTTDSAFYTWRFEEGDIDDPFDVAEDYLEDFVDEERPYIIALTHLGLSADRVLVRKNHGLDLVIGGHSHHAMKVAEYIVDQKDKNIPIVQAGSHGEYLGRLELSLNNGEIKILSYELIPVLREIKGEEEMISSAYEKLEEEYSKEWLYEPLGKSNLSPVKEKESKQSWGLFLAKTFKEYGDSEIAIHASDLGGHFPAGSIDRVKIYNSYPRQFEFEQRSGWSLFRIKLFGHALKYIIKYSIELNLPLYFAGVTFDIEYGDELEIENIRVDGKEVSKLRRYTVTVPEGISRGGRGISWWTRLVYQNQTRLADPVWEVIAKAVKKNKTVDFIDLESMDKRAANADFYQVVMPAKYQRH